MMWGIDFISEEDFKYHVKETIRRYGEKLKPFDLAKFNSNIIDPVKMIFDRAVYKKDWGELVASEIFRQRDKTNSNEIGYFHQRIFQYMKGCRVPDNGKEGGWDVIYTGGYEVTPGEKVNTVFVEMKNKHNTMNSSSATRTYMKMQNQLLYNDDCVCFLVEAIAKQSQDIVWKARIDSRVMAHRRIRRVSLDKFYEIITGEPDAFYQICLALPGVIEQVMSELPEVEQTEDTVLEELKKQAKAYPELSEEMALVMTIYMLGFSTYNGFRHSE